MRCRVVTYGLPMGGCSVVKTVRMGDTETILAVTRRRGFSFHIVLWFLCTLKFKSTKGSEPGTSLSKAKRILKGHIATFFGYWTPEEEGCTILQYRLVFYSCTTVFVVAKTAEVRLRLAFPRRRKLCRAREQFLTI